MSNTLRIDLTNRVVLLRREAVTGTTSDELGRLFRCESGDGLNPLGPGVGIKGHFLHNRVYGKETTQINAAEDIERLASEREIMVAEN